MGRRARRRSPSGPRRPAIDATTHISAPSPSTSRALYDIERPAWAVEPDRFLETWWFVSDVPGFRAISIAQARAAFVKHGVFLPERSLHRVLA
jgi:hypothetical protein